MDHTYGLDFRKKLEISHRSDLELEKQTWRNWLVILTVRTAIYATLNLLLVLVFLYIAIHSYHTFYTSNLHHYTYNLTVESVTKTAS